MHRDSTTFTGDFKRFFLRGLGILLPSVLTLWIVVQAYLFVEAQVAEPINRGIRSGVLWVLPHAAPERNHPEWFRVTPEEVAQFRGSLAIQGTAEAQSLLKHSDEALRTEIRAAEFKRFWDGHWYFRFIGLIVAVTLIYLAGLLLGGFLGRHVYLRLERFIARIPIFKQVYPHVKQLVELVLGERSMAFKKVVLVEYPRKGIWTLGFVSGGGLHQAERCAGSEVLTVFIPSTPTPFTGFTITVRKDEAIEVSITIDEAIRFVLTGGVLAPTLPAPAPLPRAGAVRTAEPLRSLDAPPEEREGV
jgi:uncharacterized membrane protein